MNSTNATTVTMVKTSPVLVPKAEEVPPPEPKAPASPPPRPRCSSTIMTRNAREEQQGNEKGDHDGNGFLSCLAAAAAAIMPTNSSTFSAVPPTRAPSTSGWVISSAALEALTEPPYCMRIPAAVGGVEDLRPVRRGGRRGLPGPVPWWH